MFGFFFLFGTALIEATNCNSVTSVNWFVISLVCTAISYRRMAFFLKTHYPPPLLPLPPADSENLITRWPQTAIKIN